MAFPRPCSRFGVGYFKGGSVGPRPPKRKLIQTERGREGEREGETETESDGERWRERQRRILESGGLSASDGVGCPGDQETELLQFNKHLSSIRPPTCRPCPRPGGGTSSPHAPSPRPAGAAGRGDLSASTLSRMPWHIPGNLAPPFWKHLASHFPGK